MSPAVPPVVTSLNYKEASKGTTSLYFHFPPTISFSLEISFLASLRSKINKREGNVPPTPPRKWGEGRAGTGQACGLEDREEDHACGYRLREVGDPGGESKSEIVLGLPQSP